MKLTVKNVLILNLLASNLLALVVLYNRFSTEPVLVISLTVFFAMFNTIMTKVAKVYGFEFDVDDGKLKVEAQRTITQTTTKTETTATAEGAQHENPN